jgi:lipocalin
MKTKRIRLLAAGFAVLLLLASCATPPGKSTAGIPGVKSIDMGRYLDRWYEISRIPDLAVMGDVNDNRIIALDEDYSWLVVTSRTKDYFWILSRTPTMDAGAYDSVVSVAKGWWFDASRLEKVRQEWD